jgi:hypothetical protein
MSHEVGHVLGLGHERDLDSVTMFPSIGPGEVHMRTLHDDDIAGASELYNLEFMPAPMEPRVTSGCRHESAGVLFIGLFAFRRWP